MSIAAINLGPSKTAPTAADRNAVEGWTAPTERDAGEGWTAPTAD